MQPSTSHKRSRNDEETENSSIKRIRMELKDNTLNEADEYRPNIYENRNREDIQIRKKEEAHFLRLFTSILNAIITVKRLNDIYIGQSIVTIRKSFIFDTGPFSFSAIDFTKWENICGYIYRYASHGAGFARFRILKAIRSCTVVEEILKKPDSKIVCLGTGPGNDAVGLCSALSELHYPKNLKMILVDKFKEWSLCIKLAKVFIEEDNLGKVSELFHNTNVELLFIQTDLPGNVVKDAKYFGILAEADVIVMSKLVSILDKCNAKDAERVIVKSLYEHMKEDAVILLNDFLDKEIWDNFHLVYSWGDMKEDEYMSSALSEKRFNHSDAVSSKLPINVLVKKEPLENIFFLRELFDYSEFP